MGESVTRQRCWAELDMDLPSLLLCSSALLPHVGLTLAAAVDASTPSLSLSLSLSLSPSLSLSLSLSLPSPPLTRAIAVSSTTPFPSHHSVLPPSRLIRCGGLRRCSAHPSCHCLSSTSSSTTPGQPNARQLTAPHLSQSLRLFHAHVDVASLPPFRPRLSGPPGLRSVPCRPPSV